MAIQLSTTTFPLTIREGAMAPINWATRMVKMILARIPRTRAMVLRQRRVEVTRADERHDRVDVLRAILGLTVACARCHDISTIHPTKDTIARGNFREHMYQEISDAAQVVGNMTSRRKGKAKEKLLAKSNRRRASARRNLALQCSKYMQAAWRVTGERRTKLPK